MSSKERNEKYFDNPTFAPNGSEYSSGDDGGG